MTSIYVPRPGIFYAPYTRTQHALMMLMADERNQTDTLWLDEAYTVIQYTQQRVALYPETLARAAQRRSEKNPRNKTHGATLIDQLENGVDIAVLSEQLSIVEADPESEQAA